MIKRGSTMRFSKNVKLTLAACAALYVLPLFATTVVYAQDKKKPPPGFERVAGAPESEKVDPNGLVIGAYAAFFVGMFGYIVHVARKQTEMAKEMAELAERINRADKS